MMRTSRQRTAGTVVRETRPRYVICVSDDGYPASLEVRKVYRTVADPDAAEQGLVRVIDESGEAYLYSEAYFVAIDVPKDAEACFAGSVADDAEAE